MATRTRRYVPRVRKLHCESRSVQSFKGASSTGKDQEQNAQLPKGGARASRKNSRPEVQSPVALIANHGRQHRWQDVLLVLHQLGGQVDVITRNAAVAACANSLQWQMALALLEASIRWRTRIDLVACNTALLACERGQQWRLAQAYLQRMQTWMLLPDVRTYNSLIRLTASEKKNLGWISAFCLLEDMLQMMLRADLQTMNAIAGACRNDSRWELVLSLVLELRNAGLRPDSVTCSIAVSACNDSGMWTRALQMLDFLQSCYAQPNMVTFSSAVNACEKSGQWEASLALMRAMKTSCILPNVVTYGAAISACEKAAQWERALMLLFEMC